MGGAAKSELQAKRKKRVYLIEKNDPSTGNYSQALL